MKKWIVIGIGLLLLFTISGGVLLYFLHSPQYSLGKVRIALRERDLAEFEKYFDIKDVSDNMVDLALEKAKSESVKPKDGWDEFAPNLIALLKPRLVEAVSDQIRKLVELGAYESPDEKPVYDLSVFEKGSVFKEIVYIKKNGKIATAGICIRPPNGRKEFILEVVMRNKGSYWQIFKINNIFDPIE